MTDDSNLFVFEHELLKLIRDMMDNIRVNHITPSNEDYHTTDRTIAARLRAIDDLMDKPDEYVPTIITLYLLISRMKLRAQMRLKTIASSTLIVHVNEAEGLRHTIEMLTDAINVCARAVDFTK